ncbi:hypothetical protein C8J57DRAFT_1222954 [Mycena rebaudengoi]|nr:hypothetical protein C8J57DRAFT_1222954 [Mycena rebaudengoi]
MRSSIQHTIRTIPRTADGRGCIGNSMIFTNDTDKVGIPACRRQTIRGSAPFIPHMPKLAQKKTAGREEHGGQGEGERHGARIPPESRVDHGTRDAYVLATERHEAKPGKRAMPATVSVSAAANPGTLASESSRRRKRARGAGAGLWEAGAGVARGIVEVLCRMPATSRECVSPGSARRWHEMKEENWCARDVEFGRRETGGQTRWWRGLGGGGPKRPGVTPRHSEERLSTAHAEKMAEGTDGLHMCMGACKPFTEKLV